MTIRDPVSLESACAFLAERYGAVADVTEAGRGEWSIAYGFRRDGGHYVVRFGRHRDDFEKDRLAAAFAAPHLPIPQVLELGEAFGAYYAISERVFGDYLDQLDGAAMRATLPGVFATLDAIRLADVSLASTDGAAGNALAATWTETLLALPDDAPSARVGGWRERLARSAEGSRVFDDAYAALAEFVARCPGEKHLVHNDTLNRNVFVRDGRVTGVIDWGCMMYGDFVYDIALMSFWWPWYSAWSDIDLVTEAERHYESIGLHVPRFRERLRCYQTHIGVGHLVYTAHLERWSDLEWIAARTLKLMAARV